MLKNVALTVLGFVLIYCPLLYGFYLIHPGIAWIMASVLIGINIWHYSNVADKKAEEAERAKKRETAERKLGQFHGLLHNQPSPEPPKARPVRPARPC